jgi:DNA polymerase-3 subunit epsilon
MRQIAFDIETTGIKFQDGHRIVEIGGVELVNGAVTGRHFHVYVNPEREVPDGAYRIHGLSTEFLQDKPRFADGPAAPAFLDFVGEADLIAHNGAAFDLPFLQAELESAHLPLLKNKIADTLIMARRKYPGAPASLDALCARFGIDAKEREREGHGALLDSRLLAEVYIELTGGAQAGLNFGRFETGGARTPGPARGRTETAARAARPRPLPARFTEEERAAHEKFIEELGENCLWRRRA